MAKHSDLDIRMKEYYEQISKTKLMRRTPVILRVDGKAFHTFTKGFERPFDDVLIKTMQETTKYLCENIQGCVLGYTQSDEISLVLVDYQKFNSSAWFDYEVQKLCSITASLATNGFNKAFHKNVYEYAKSMISDTEFLQAILYGKFPEVEDKRLLAYLKSLHRGAEVDSRCFNIPKEEVTNCIYWRQLDASRNSVQMVGQSNFSTKELKGKSNSDVQDMLMLQKGINWNDFPAYQKRGTCVVKEEYAINENGEEVEIEDITDVGEPTEDVTIRTRWVIDKDIPIFKGDARKYIDKLFMVGE